jgi:Na+/phosphate symporter
MTCSALFLASGRWKPAVLAGLVAVLLRELVVLYIIVALTIALFRGDRRQAVAWTGVLAVFAVYLGLHALEVGARLTDLDLRHDGGWIQFGGLGFVLATVRMQPLLLIAPAAVTAIYLPLTVLGLLAWEDRKALVLRATCIGFIAAFLVVGRPVNYYWGFLYAPLLALGVGWSARGGKALAAALGIYPRLLGSAGWP